MVTRSRDRFIARTCLVILVALSLSSVACGRAPSVAADAPGRATHAAATPIAAQGHEPASCIDRSVDVAAEYGLPSPAVDDTDPALGPVHVTLEETVHYSSVRELVADSERAVIGQVTSAPCGRVSGIFGLRNIEVAVESTLVGPDDDQIVFEQFDWDPTVHRPMLVVDPQFHIGDRLVVFLNVSDVPGLYRPSTYQAVYRVEGDEIADTDRQDPFVRRVEAMTLRELERAVRAAG